jgi:uncharacterized protein YutE (UPF0331/DUF86 family)
VADYLAEVAKLRNILDSRYDDFETGRVKPINGEAFFEELRQPENELFKKRQS